MCEEKQCNSCLSLLPASEFHRNGSRRDGLCGACKRCASERRRMYYAKNKKKILTKLNAWREQNRDTIRERDKRYKRSPKAIARAQALRQTTKWKVDNARRQRLYREQHPEKAKIQQQQKRARSREAKSQQTLIRSLSPEKMAELQGKLEKLKVQQAKKCT